MEWPNWSTFLVLYSTAWQILFIFKKSMKFDIPEKNIFFLPLEVWKYSWNHSWCHVNFFPLLFVLGRGMMWNSLHSLYPIVWVLQFNHGSPSCCLSSIRNIMLKPTEQGSQNFQKTHLWKKISKTSGYVYPDQKNPLD